MSWQAWSWLGRLIQWFLFSLNLINILLKSAETSKTSVKLKLLELCKHFFLSALGFIKAEFSFRSSRRIRQSSFVAAGSWIVLFILIKLFTSDLLFFPLAIMILNSIEAGRVAIFYLLRSVLRHHCFVAVYLLSHPST